MANIKQKTLHLILKKKWFDLIKSGEKKEEYRDIKRLYFARLVEKHIGTEQYCFKEFDTVTFQLGYAKDAQRVIVKWEGCGVGTGLIEWGAEPGTKYFVIKLGEVVTNG